MVKEVNNMSDVAKKERNISLNQLERTIHDILHTVHETQRLVDLRYWTLVNPVVRPSENATLEMKTPEAQPILMRLESDTDKLGHDAMDLLKSLTELIDRIHTDDGPPTPVRR